MKKNLNKKTKSTSKLNLEDQNGISTETVDEMNNIISIEPIQSSVNESESISELPNLGSNEEGAPVNELHFEKTVQIEFPYSDVLRSQAPKVFEVAEKVATSWINEKPFDDIELGHPMADLLAKQALNKAKEIEKKLEEKGVFAMGKMGLQLAQMQIENLKNKFKK